MLTQTDDNLLDEFPVFTASSGHCRVLRSLRLNRNRLASLDIESYCPNVESLYADGNVLSDVPGLEHLRHLRTFSAREQMLATDSDNEKCVANLARNAEIRNLYISLNPSRSLELPQHMLNLQRLELASMGLMELPDTFGQTTPNVRSINLNFNSIQDLRPLLNIKRLDELLVAGNKLARLRTNLAVLGKLTTLSKVDIRDNPLTLRFYPPTSEKRVMSLRQKTSYDDATDRFVLPDGDAEADQQYLQRLDFETRLRRRVQEIMLSTQCRNLRELDGLPFDRSRILKKDDIWDRLLFLGVIKKTDTTEG
jgi:Leucine-rich repeat (LRR) protein